MAHVLADAVLELRIAAHLHEGVAPAQVGRAVLPDRAPPDLLVLRLVRKLAGKFVDVWRAQAQDAVAREDAAHVAEHAQGVLLRQVFDEVAGKHVLDAAVGDAAEQVVVDHHTVERIQVGPVGQQPLAAANVELAVEMLAGNESGAGIAGQHFGAEKLAGL